MTSCGNITRNIRIERTDPFQRVWRNPHALFNFKKSPQMDKENVISTKTHGQESEVTSKRRFKGVCHLTVRVPADLPISLAAKPKMFRKKVAPRGCRS